MIRLLSLFSGIGAFESALRRGGYQFETVNYCEIDPYASKAYSQIHGIPEEKNLHDVREINPLLLDNINLVTFGFPCQDISVAGKQRGFEHDGERTRSGLFFEALRIIEFLQPEYAIAENVKALTGKKFTAEFETVLTSLDKAGYNNYWKVLNAKDYGIPQNRERVFIVSIRKDIDTGTFTFPEKRPLQLRVKDMLEPEVDEKFYINSDRAKKLIEKITASPEIVGGGTENRIKTIGHLGTGGQKGWVFNANGISRCLAATDYKDPTKIVETRTMIEITEPKVKQVGNIVTTGNFENPQRGRIYDSEGISPCLDTRLKPKFIEPVICRSVGRDPDNPSNRKKGCNTEQTLELKKDGCSNTLTTVQKDNMVLEPKIKNIGSINGHQSGNVLHHDSDLSPCLCVAGHVVPLKIMQVGNVVDTGHLEVVNIKRLGNLYDENAGGSYAGNVYDPNGLAPTIRTAQGGGLQPHILVNPDVCGNDVCRTIKNQYYKTSTANFERTGTHGATGVLDVTNYRIRKLTPRECFRLMGFTDSDFDKIKGISNTQLYKQAGNSIVVNVLEAIFKQLFKETNKE